MICRLVFVAVVAFLWAAPACADCPVGTPDIFVSPAGRDDADGQTADSQTSATADGHGPVATLNRAAALIRALKHRQGDRGRAYVVRVAAGRYELADPIILNAVDSGFARSPIVYCAASGDTALFSGGTRLGGWRLLADGGWTAPLADPAQASGLRQMFLNGERRYVGRFPAHGYFMTGADGGEGALAGLAYGGSDVRPEWAGNAAVSAVLLDTWSTVRMRIEHVDSAAHVVRLEATIPRATSAITAAGRRYIVEGAPGSAGPGQWEVAADGGNVIYRPLAGEQITDTTVIVPRLTTLLQIGNAAEYLQTEFIRVDGLTFADADWRAPPGGSVVGQAATTIAGAISVDHVHGVALHDIAVMHTGGAALTLGPRAFNVNVADCLLFDLGGGGIQVASRLFDSQPGDRRITIAGCTIRSGGRLHPSAAGIWVGNADGVAFTGNQISDFYYTGISVGWKWGYDGLSAADVTVSRNAITDIGQGVMSDLGGIYTLGASRNLRIEDNVVRGVGQAAYGGWGIYLDEGSSGVLVRGNSIDDTAQSAVYIHFGRDNRIIGNRLIVRRGKAMELGRAEGHVAATFSGNRILLCGAEPVEWASSAILGSGNVVERGVAVASGQSCARPAKGGVPDVRLAGGLSLPGPGPGPWRGPIPPAPRAFD